MSSSNQRVKSKVDGHTFTISSKYDLSSSRIVGGGNFGIVATGIDTKKGKLVAIKRVRPYANDDIDARRVLREIKLLKILSPHPTIIGLADLSINEERSELYIVMELMDTNLERVIYGGQPLEESHRRHFAKQLLEGVKALHAIGVIHRDLKPPNILISKGSQLRISDFGLARYVDEATLQGENTNNPLTEYVVTRRYRPPELLLAPYRPYNTSVDLWSVGCIFAELYRRAQLFPAKSHTEQVTMILELLGYRHPVNLGFRPSAEVLSFLDKQCRFPGKPFSEVMPDTTAQDACDLITSLLSLNPKRRSSAARALECPYFEGIAIADVDYSKDYLVRPPADFFEFENSKKSLDFLREKIHDEVSCGKHVFSTGLSKDRIDMRSPLPREPLQSEESSPNIYVKRRRSFESSSKFISIIGLPMKEESSVGLVNVGHQEELSSRGTARLGASSSIASIKLPSARGLHSNSSRSERAWQPVSSRSLSAKTPPLTVSETNDNFSSHAASPNKPLNILKTPSPSILEAGCMILSTPDNLRDCLSKSASSSRLKTYEIVHSKARGLKENDTSLRMPIPAKPEPLAVVIGDGTIVNDSANARTSNLDDSTKTSTGGGGRLRISSFLPKLKMVSSSLFGKGAKMADKHTHSHAQSENQNGVVHSASPPMFPTPPVDPKPSMLGSH